MRHPVPTPAGTPSGRGSGLPGTPAPRAFLPALRELERRLSVPIPERVRILRELEYDLEELCTRLVASGLRVEEARARALEVLVPGGAALEWLDDLHAPAYRRLTRRIRDDRLRLLERTALALATAMVLVVEGLVVVSGGLFLVPQALAWPVLIVGALLFAAVAVTAFRLWIRRDHGPSPIGVAVVLWLSGAVLVVALAGVSVDSDRVFATLAASPELARAMLPAWLRRTTALLALSALIALAGALAWFVMTQWYTAVLAAYRDVLGLDPSNHSTGGADHG